MALKRIQDLTAATTPLDGTELVELEQGGASVKCTAQDIADLGGGGGGSGTVTSVALAMPDIFGVTGSPVTTSGTLTATSVDPGADRIVFWDDSAGKWVYLTPGSGLTISGTTMTADVQTVNGDAGAVIVPVPIGIACSDETTVLTTGTAKATFRMPHAMTLTGVRASLTTAQATGSTFTVDINEAGASILSTKITVDNTEKTSTTAATPPVISDSALADDAEITIDIDQVGDGTATGLKVWLIGYPT
jgi:hypothetical protein